MTTKPPYPQAEALLARIAPEQAQPALAAEIDACPCPDEVKAGLHLLNGDWQRAHVLAQGLDTPLGAHWHALVHRHEPDYANSKYWLRRVGDSPIYPALAAAARQAGHGETVAPGGAWDAAAFTDCYADPARPAWTRELDALEMRTLLAHCLGR